MQDRYLFRGKRVGNGEWEFGYPVPSAGLDSSGWLMTVMHGSGNTVTSNTYRVDPATIGQCTGLRDKNGKLIFEGDIIRCTCGCPHAVIWHKEYGGQYLGGMPAFYLSGLGNGYAWVGEELLIGNIHDNPELLSKEAQHG